MKKLILCGIISCMSLLLSAQIKSEKFGKGLQFQGKDSTFYLRVGFRFQSLFVNEWEVVDDDLGSLENYEGNFLIRRSRLKFDGWAYTPKLKYKLELGLSNRDIGNGDSPEFNNASRIILDAYVAWNFHKNLTIQFGQAKLPGNRERVISSGNLQLVDRSRLNSRFNIDRDVGFQLKNHHTIGDQFLIREVVAISQGVGRNVTAGHFGGYDYTFRLEALPFGKFQSKGDYVGSAVKRESTPKLALGFTYDINDNATRERGQNGSFIQDENGTYFGKTLKTFFADMMFKYQGLSVMVEYADKKTDDDSPFVVDEVDNVIGTFYTGSGLNIAAGYLFDCNWEVAARLTTINPDTGVGSDEKRYTVGVSRFVVGHKLKVQTDLTYRSRDSGNDNLIFRTQVDIHF